jgi:hypothetical protein
VEFSVNREKHLEGEEEKKEQEIDRQTKREMEAEG